jgi:hypothetical protein
MASSLSAPFGVWHVVNDLGDFGDSNTKLGNDEPRYERVRSFGLVNPLTNVDRRQRVI